MGNLRIEVAVEMDGGQKHAVVVDQRDYARLEAQDLPESGMHTRIRFLAWSAMTRQQITTATFKAFNEELCVEALILGDEEPADEEDGEGEQDGLDPGRGGVPAA